MKICAHNPVMNMQNDKFSFKSAYVKPKLNVDSFSFLDKYVNEGTASKKLVQDLKSYISLQRGKIKETDVKKVIGYGGLTTVFELTNDRILKCSLENPLEHREHCTDFDIPFLFIKLSLIKQCFIIISSILPYIITSILGIFFKLWRIIFRR